MAHHGDKHGMRHDLEYQHPGLDSHRAQEQALAKIAELAPDHRITIENYPGRGQRFVAKATAPAATPYLLITADLSELQTALAIPPRPN
jgi:hypothetical protein